MTTSFVDTPEPGEFDSPAPIIQQAVHNPRPDLVTRPTGAKVRSEAGISWRCWQAKAGVGRTIWLSEDGGAWIETTHNGAGYHATIDDLWIRTKRASPGSILGPRHVFKTFVNAAQAVARARKAAS